MSSGSDVSTVDRISKLPESIITEILNLVPTKDAVATSLLSKSWRLRWTQVTTFDSEGSLMDDDANLRKFVDRALANTKFEFIRKFRLWSYRFGETWLSPAIFATIKVLDLATNWNRRVQLPPEFFTCKTVEVMNLAGGFEINLPGVACLPRLAELELTRPPHQLDEAVTVLISSCPVLQSLTIKKTILNGGHEFTVSSLSLKRLHIFLDVCRQFTVGNPETSSRKLRIDAPALEYLVLHDSASAEISITSSAVNEADLDLIYHDAQPDTIVGLLETFRSVKCLRLSENVMSALDKATKRLSASFESLNKLAVDYGHSSDQSSRLVELMDRCVNLQVLQIYCDSSEFPWSPAVFPRCLSSSLKTLKVTFKPACSRFDQVDLTLIEFILNHGSVLERVDIHIDFPDASDSNSNSCTDEIFQQLLMMHRAAPTCRFYRRIGGSAALEYFE